MLFREHKGNSLTEYLIPAAIVGTILLVTINTLVPNLGDYLQASMGAQGSGQSPTNSKVLNTKAYGENPTMKSLTVTLSDGTVLNLENYPADLASSIEVDGANGTTDKLSAVLESLAQQLKEQGKITETQYQQLLALANKGHELGIIERLLEDNIADLASNGEGTYKKYPYKGKLVEANELVSAIGFHTNQYADTMSLNLKEDPSVTKYLSQFGLQTDAVDPDRMAVKVGIPFYEFVKKYQEVESSGLFAEPQLGKIIEALSSRIVYIGDATQDNITDILKNNKNPAALQDQVASTMTHANSSDLCTTGNGKDSGVECSR